MFVVFGVEIVGDDKRLGYGVRLVNVKTRHGTCRVDLQVPLRFLVQVDVDRLESVRNVRVKMFVFSLKDCKVMVE